MFGKLTPTPCKAPAPPPTGPKMRDSCSACAASKVKCHKEKPWCSRCLKRGRKCEYFATRRAGRKKPRDAPFDSAGSTSTGTVSGSGSGGAVTAPCSAIVSPAGSATDVHSWFPNGFCNTFNTSLAFTALQFGDSSLLDQQACAAFPFANTGLLDGLGQHALGSAMTIDSTVRASSAVDYLALSTSLLDHNPSNGLSDSAYFHLESGSSTHASESPNSILTAVDAHVAGVPASSPLPARLPLHDPTAYVQQDQRWPSCQSLRGTVAVAPDEYCLLQSMGLMKGYSPCPAIPCAAPAAALEPCSHWESSMNSHEISTIQTDLAQTATPSMR